MSSFLPVAEHQQEIETVRNQLSENEPMEWPTVENEPLNEYQVILLINDFSEMSLFSNE